MRAPRIPPANIDELEAEPAKLVAAWSGDRPPINIVLTYMQNYELNKNWAALAAHLFFKSSLTDRQREIIVLRSCWLCRSDYEFIQHLRVVREGAILSEEELQDTRSNNPSAIWSVEEAAILRAVGELIDRAGITDETWAVLRETLSDQQLIDMVVTVGGYSVNAMACNSFAIELDPGLVQEPGLTPSQQGPAKQDVPGHARHKLN